MYQILKICSFTRSKDKKSDKTKKLGVLTVAISHLRSKDHVLRLPIGILRPYRVPFLRYNTTMVENRRFLLCDAIL